MVNISSRGAHKISKAIYENSIASLSRFCLRQCFSSLALTPTVFGQSPSGSSGVKCSSCSGGVLLRHQSLGISQDIGRVLTSLKTKYSKYFS